MDNNYTWHVNPPVLGMHEASILIVSLPIAPLLHIF